MPKTKKAIGYIRISKIERERGEDNNSLSLQRNKIYRYADLHDMDLLKIYSDPGISAKDIAGRPAMRRLLDAVRTGQVDAVIIFKLDRMARDTQDALFIAEEIKSNGASLHLIHDNVDTSTPAGKLFFTILAAMATWERETIAERTRQCMGEKKEKGERYSGVVPYGMMDVNGILEKHPEEQEALRLMRRMRSKGMTVRAISDALFEQGFEPRSGGRFSIALIDKLTKGLKPPTEREIHKQEVKEKLQARAQREWLRRIEQQRTGTEG